MDETSPVFENFLNNMSKFSGGTTRRVAASKFLQRDDKPTVEGNARKITLITKVLKARRINTGQMISSLSGGSVKGVEQNIMDIKETMMSILGTLEAQEKFEYEKFLDMQRRTENDRRRRRESGLELDKKGLKLINSGVNKILRPVRSIFSRVLSGIFNLIAGRLLIKLLNFFANPRNAAIVNFLSKFVETFFPVLLAGVAAAAIGLGILTSGFTLAANIIRGASIGLGIVPAGTGTVGGLRERRGVSGKDINVFNIFKKGGFKNIIRAVKFNVGGIVPGRGNTDSVPAMLTPGEIVISKPAVETIGAARLLRLNRKFGGATGRPSYRGGVAYAKDGMEVKPEMSNIELETTEVPRVDTLADAFLSSVPNLQTKDLFKTLSDPSIPKELEKFGKQFEMSKENQKNFAKNIFQTVIGGIFEKLNSNKETNDDTIKPDKDKKTNDDNLKPVDRISTSKSQGLTEINDILSQLDNSNETIEFENDVLNISLNSPDLNKLETLGMMA